MRLRPLIEGLGIAFLLLVNHASLLVSPYHLTHLHSLLPLNSVARGMLLDVALFVAVWIIFRLWARGKQNPALALIWAAIAAFVPWKLFDSLFLMWSGSAERWDFSAWWFGVRRPVIVLLLLLTLSFARFLSRYTHVLVQITEVLLLCSGICFSVTLVRMVYVAVRPEPTEQWSFARPRHVQNIQGPRIVWLIFDELSYDQISRAANRPLLPAFTRIRAESLEFSNLVPAGFLTDRAVPSYLLGRRVEQVRSNLEGQLEILFTGSNSWTTFSPSQTVFGEAKRMGKSTGVVGWFNPYCRILSDVLDSCVWRNETIFPFRVSGEKSSLENGVRLPVGLALKAFRSDDSGDRVEALEYLLSAGDTLLRDDSVDLALIHLPIPHPPGIYSRSSHTIGPYGNYIDNLILADNILDRFRKILLQTPRAQQTILIVSSDHSWRVPVWIHAKGWTKEEEQATGGAFDPRPVLIVNFPGAIGHCEASDNPQSMMIHDVIIAILRGRANSSGDLLSNLALEHAGDCRSPSVNADLTQAQP